MSEQIQQLFKKALQNRNQEEEKAQEEKKKVEELEERNSQKISEVKEDIKTIEDSKTEEPKVEEDLEDNKEKRIMISIDKLEDFPNQPFKPYSEEKQAEMIESIKINGIIQDLIVRPLPNGKYQILSGHNRRDCAKIVGLTELPCKIKDIEDDDASLILIDSNLIQRKDFFPSEMAKGLLIKK